MHLFSLPALHGKRAQGNDESMKAKNAYESAQVTQLVFWGGGDPYEQCGGEAGNSNRVLEALALAVSTTERSTGGRSAEAPTTKV